MSIVPPRRAAVPTIRVLRAPSSAIAARPAPDVVRCTGAPDECARTRSVPHDSATGADTPMSSGRTPGARRTGWRPATYGTCPLLGRQVAESGGLVLTAGGRAPA